MRRFRLLHLAVAAFVAAMALRYVLLGHALTSASIDFGSSFTTGAAGTTLVYCTVTSPASPDPVKRPSKNGTATSTATLTCFNNSGTSMTFTPSAGTISPAGSTSPTFAWSPASFAVASGTSGSSVVTFSVTKNDSAGTFTYTFNVSGTTSPLVTEYSHNGYAVTVRVQ